MFYLRIISKGQEQNICLGRNYRKVTSEFECHESWVRIPREKNPICGMFIFPEEGEPIPIYEDFDNSGDHENTKFYIVTESGNTYERLYPKNIYINELTTAGSDKMRSMDPSYK